MRTIALRGALALALAAVPMALVAQDVMIATMTAEQQSAYDNWPADQRAGFETWPTDYRAYYWTLSANQQTGYWKLTNEQRATIAGLTPEQQIATWASIEQQMAGSPAPTSATVAGTGDTMTTAVTQPGSDTLPQVTTVTTSSGNYAPPPASAMNKAYPLCSRTVQDSCINPREAGKNYGNRPLGYWPGKPASEGQGG